MSSDLAVKFMALLVIVISIALHEFGHAAMATKLGDPTPRLQGRLTLNPLAHFDPIGFIFILFTIFAGFGIGWGKPVQMNPLYFKEYRQGILLTAMAGPAMNLSLACLGVAVGYIFFLGRIELNPVAHLFLAMLVMLNLALMFFNLLPIPPLDGGYLLRHLFPRSNLVHWLNSYGMLVILALVMFRLAWPVLAFLRFASLWLIAQAFGSDYVNYLVGASPF